MPSSHMIFFKAFKAFQQLVKWSDQLSASKVMLHVDAFSDRQLKETRIFDRRVRIRCVVISTLCARTTKYFSDDWLEIDR